jgi:hypothetical protein
MGSAGISGFEAPSPSGKEVNEGWSGECVGGAAEEGGCCVTVGLEPSSAAAGVAPAVGSGLCAGGGAASPFVGVDDIISVSVVDMLLLLLCCVLHPFSDFRVRHVARPTLGSVPG